MAQTISQAFAQKGLWAWFNSPVTNYYDGANEKGEDYSTAFGTPVCVPVGGTIKRIVHNNNAINDIVELMDTDGAVWLYQHITATVKVGQTLQCGGQVGTENGLPIDQYSTGPHIEVRYISPGKWNPHIESWIEQWENPRAVFSKVGDQPAGSVSTSALQTIAQAFTGKGGKLPIQLAPTADVTALLWTFDELLTVSNPFDVNATTDTINAAGVTASFTDPVSWVEGFGGNLVDNMVAINMRFIFIVIGVVIIIKVLNNFIDFENLFDSGMQTLKSAIQLGEVAAL